MSLNQCLGSTERGGWRGVGRKVWQRAGQGLAKGWPRVGGFPCTLQFRNSRGTRLETQVCDSMVLKHDLPVHGNSSQRKKRNSKKKTRKGRTGLAPNLLSAPKLLLN